MRDVYLDFKKGNEAGVSISAGFSAELLLALQRNSDLILVSLQIC